MYREDFSMNIQLTYMQGLNEKYATFLKTTLALDVNVLRDKLFLESQLKVVLENSFSRRKIADDEPCFI